MYDFMEHQFKKIDREAWMLFSYFSKSADDPKSFHHISQKRFSEK
jgi:hypothetical protein